MAQPHPVFSLVATGALGYLLGSVPAAYLLVRWKSKIDIRNAGSGNVGTLNSFQVTRSKLVGGAVLVVDVFKGFVAVVLASVLFSSDAMLWAVAGTAAVIGHNYPLWLGFKGGRGLAPAAGAMLALGYGFIVVWGISWAIAFALTRRVNIGNVIATAALLIFIAATPAHVLALLVAAHVPLVPFRYLAILMLAAILSKHVEPVREHFLERKVLKRTQGNS